MDKDCLFCLIDPERIIWQNHLVFIIFDAYPVSKGHMLIIPKRHIRSFFDTTESERASLMQGIDKAKHIIEEQSQQDSLPEGYNIGINDGTAAGQTIPHLHIHLIPRYKNDLPDPRGGVRWIFPENAKYWS